MKDLLPERITISFTTVNFIRSENKPSIAVTFMYLGTSEHML